MTTPREGPSYGPGTGVSDEFWVAGRSKWVVKAR